MPQLRPNEIVVRVKVFPESRHERIVEDKKGALEVFVKEPAVEGRANARLLKVLKIHFGATVRVISGGHRRSKLILVGGSK